MSNFSFLQAEWPDVHDEAARAEQIAVADPRASCFYARRCLEIAVTWLFQADNTLRLPYRDDLAAKLSEPTLMNLVGPAIRTKMDVIRRQGNAAVHRPGPITANDSVKVVAELFQVMYWIARKYSRDPADLPAGCLAFDSALIPRPLPAAVRQQRQADLQAQAEQFAKQQSELADQRRKNQDLDAEIETLRAEILVAKAANDGPAGYARLQRGRDPHASSSTCCWTRLAGRCPRSEDREFQVTGMPTP